MFLLEDLSKWPMFFEWGRLPKAEEPDPEEGIEGGGE